MTPLELREKGYQVLVSNLGQIDAIRFLQQMAVVPPGFCGETMAINLRISK